MHDALLMGVVQAPAHLEHHGQLFLEGQGRTLRDESPQLFALQQLHDDEEAAIVLAHVVDGDDVGMVQLRARLGLAEEAGAQLVGDLDLGRDDLEGDLTIEDGVVGLEDHAHAPAADPVDDPILPDLLGQPGRPADAHGSHRLTRCSERGWR